MVFLYCFILIIFCLLGLSWFAGSGAPYVPTKYPKLKELFKKIGLSKDQLFYELGSGDGLVVIEAAKIGARSIGIEESWLRVLWSRYKAKKLNLSNAVFWHGDIFKKSYADGDLIFIYLLPVAVDKLESKLQLELKKGAKVITQKYHFKNWQPYQKIDNFWIYRA